MPVRSLAAVALTAVLTAAASAAVAQPPADRIWSGGPILTMNDKAMRVQALAESGGRIVAVGSTARVMRLRGPNTEMIDLQGRTLLPGFIDPHGHMVIGGLQALSANLLAPPDGTITDIPALLQAMREWVAANKDAVETTKLIIGFGYDPATLKERRHPTRDELDTISMDIPVMLVHQSAHFGAVNSKALEAAGITAATRDPAGGIIRRRAGTQEPDGVLEELAFASLASKLLPRVGPNGVEVFAREGAQMWARYGYTTAEEGKALPDVARLLKRMADEGSFAIDVVAYVDALTDRDFIVANQSRTYANRFRVGGAKLTIDGALQGFTAWRDRPYFKPVGDFPPGYSGYPSATAEQVMDSVRWAAQEKVQLIAHANGERASDLLIAAHQASRGRFPDAAALRPVLIHGQAQRVDQVDSFKRLGVIPSLFPMHTFYWGDWHLDHTVGPVDGANLSPTGWVRQRGMIFTTHHDAPVAFPDSMRVLDATVTRESRGTGRIVGPHQRVDVITALKAMTIWAAYQKFEEKRKGSLEVGKLADLVILSADPTAVDPTTIDRIKVTETIKEGVTVFRLDDAEQRKAARMSRPGGDGGDAFSRFLTAQAVYRDLERLPPAMRRPGAARSMVGSPHDRACVLAVMDELVAAMLAQGTTQGPPHARANSL
jgi:predicted amidohydrolase YtcJ